MLSQRLSCRTSEEYYKFPSITKVFVEFAKAKLPKQVFTTLTLLSNTSTQPHRDFHHAPVENSVIALGGFRQGGI